MLSLLAFGALALQQPSTVPLEEDAKKEVVAKLKDRLLDGESARWRWPDRIDGSTTYCGFVNAKNRFGAYGGFVPYLVMMQKGTKGWFVAPIDIGSSDRNEAIVRKMCADKGYPLTEIPPE